jgi:murein DD-endopeptidase MepM/ murein hydrolase activator NlpD
MKVDDPFQDWLAWEKMRIEPAVCPVCGGQYDPLRARAVSVRDGRVYAYCSNECKGRGTIPETGPIAIEIAPVDPPDESESSWSMRGVLAMAILGGAALGFGGKLLDTTPRPVISALAQQSALAMKPEKLPTAEEALAMLSSPPPAAKSQKSGLAHEAAPAEADAWYHPLPGPKRRLPMRNTRRFGAAREGLRPEECRSGHCGVDLGDSKGEWVLAVHDGVVERVVREDDGKEGRFVRINHKGGTVVSSYIHLDYIRPELRPGLRVKAGDLVGTVGETGIHNSGPHLHFAISVRPSADGPELFIDPEPLLHLWPLQAPVTAESPTRRVKTAVVEPERRRAADALPQ